MARMPVLRNNSRKSIIHGCESRVAAPYRDFSHQFIQQRRPDVEVPAAHVAALPDDFSRVFTGLLRRSKITPASLWKTRLQVFDLFRLFRRRLVARRDGSERQKPLARYVLTSPRGFADRLNSLIQQRVITRRQHSFAPPQDGVSVARIERRTGALHSRITLHSIRAASPALKSRRNDSVLSAAIMLINGRIRLALAP